MKFPLLIFLISVITVNQNSAYAQDKVLEVGEVLVYEVYYGFIKLGRVDFSVTDTYTENNKKYYTAIAKIKSYDGVPFVEINYIFSTVMQYDKSDLFTTKFYSTEFKKKSITNIIYDFNYETGEINLEKETDGNIELESKVTIPENKKFQDGLSLFYKARIQSFENKNHNIPVFINEKDSYVKYSFNLQKDEITIDKFNYDVAVIKIAGSAGFTGVFGLNGEFAAFLSADEFRIPIKAQFNVLIGSVNLELIDYKRKLWVAPRFSN
ncbi:MAG TPA: DUF3108 domain-containing protein [Ignavibacteria bacterium]|nr:DUF3108 domain-containing protein [Ignavibacteria bacterium]